MCRHITAIPDEPKKMGVANSVTSSLSESKIMKRKKPNLIHEDAREDG
jgi:hypothetical protein